MDKLGGRVTSTEMSKHSGLKLGRERRRLNGAKVKIGTKATNQVRRKVPSWSLWLGCENWGLDSLIVSAQSAPLNSRQHGPRRASRKRTTNKFLLITALNPIGILSDFFQFFSFTSYDRSDILRTVPVPMGTSLSL